MVRRYGSVSGTIATISALVLVTALTPTVAFALHDDPQVTLLNPAAGPFADGPSGTLHLTAVAEDSEGITEVEFEVACDLDGDASNGFEESVRTHTDTTAPYSATWDSSALNAEGDHCEVTATATDSFMTTGTDSVDGMIDNSLPGVDLGEPAHGGTLTFTSSGATLRGTAEAGTTQVDAFESSAAPGADPAFAVCGSTTTDQNPGAAGFQFEVTCSDVDADTTAVRVRADSGGTDAHAVTTEAADPGDPVVTIEPSTATGRAGTDCVEFTVTVTQGGSAANGASIDVHADGPDDGLQFAQTDSTDTFSAGGPPQHQAEDAADCSQGDVGNEFEEGQDGTVADGQGDHIEPNNDTKHITGTTDAQGEFVFALLSSTTGTTNITVTATVGDDTASGSATLTWETWTLDATPQAAVNNVNLGETSHEITVTVTDIHDEPVAGAEPVGEITEGPNSVTALACDAPTDAQGQCTISYASDPEADGTDEIVVWLNTDDAKDTSDDADAGEPQDQVSTTWSQVPENACLDAEPEPGPETVNAPNTTHTITGRVTDSPGSDTNDDTCGGSALGAIGVTVAITDDAPDAYIASVNGQPTEGQPDTVQAGTDSNGEVQVAIGLVDPDGDLGDAGNTVRMRISGSSDTDAGPGDQTDNQDDLVTMDWVAEGQPAVLEVIPELDTNVFGPTADDHTLTARVVDSTGAGVEGETVTFDVYAGPNSGSDPADCTTGADGTCTTTLSAPTAPSEPTATSEDDYVRASIGAADTAEGAPDGDPTPTDADETVNPGTREPDLTDVVFKRWTSDAEADAIGLDMETGDNQCAPTDGEAGGFDNDDGGINNSANDWDPAAEPNTVGDLHSICASAKNTNGDLLYGLDLAFEVSGAGEFVDENGDSLGTSVDRPISYDGVARVFLRSTTPGTSTVTVSIADVSAEGSKTWEAGPARTVELEPESTSEQPGGSTTLTAFVGDRFANPVEGVEVTLAEDGAGTFADGSSEVTGTTDEAGQVTVTVTSQEAGKQIVTATIPPATTDCDRPADDPAGAPAGACEDQAQVAWTDVAELAALEEASQTVSAGNVVCLPIEARDSQGDGVPDVDVVAELTGTNANAPISGEAGPCGNGTGQASTGASTTDADGVASFSYTPTATGEDTVTIFADLDADEVHDDGEPSVTYTLTVIGDHTVRFAGEDRMETAVLASQNVFGDGEASAVVVARSDQFPDALAGTPLAVANDAPLLLTPSPENWRIRGQTDHLHATTRDEIVRVLADGGTIYVLGGPAAIGPGTEGDLEQLGETKRLAGFDRFETAVEIANELDPSPGTIFVTTGRKFPDALSAGAAAAQTGAVIVLTDEDESGNGEQNPDTTEYLLTHQDATMWAIGGPAAEAYPAITNTIVGESRLGTAVGVANQFFTDPTAAGIARADEFPDALSGGTHIGHLGAPLLLTNRTDLDAGWGRANSDAGALTAYLEGHADAVDVAFLYGGPAAIVESVDTEVDAAIG